MTQPLAKNDHSVQCFARAISKPIKVHQKCSNNNSFLRDNTKKPPNIRLKMHGFFNFVGNLSKFWNMKKLNKPTAKITKQKKMVAKN